MKLSIEVAGYNDAHDFNGDTHLISSRRLDKWAKSISELEAQLADLRSENERLKRYVNCGYSHVGNTENFVCTKCGYPDS